MCVILGFKERTLAPKLFQRHQCHDSIPLSEGGRKIGKFSLGQENIIITENKSVT